MKHCRTLSSLSLTAVLTIHSAAFEPPANSELVIDEDFDRAELGPGWTSQTGKWTIMDGSLHGSETESENHTAAARHVIETENAVYQMRFRLRENARAFHFGFDPKPGEIDKRGHLFSVIVTPTGWRLLKHLDKNDPEKEPNEVLASAKFNFEFDQWYALRVVTWETSVKAMIEGVPPLEGVHPSFAVKKPTLVFRVSGDGVDIDDLMVWKPRR